MYFNNTFYSTLFLVFYIFIIIYYYHLNWWIYFNLWMYYYFLVYNYIIYMIKIQPLLCLPPETVFLAPTGSICRSWGSDKCRTVGAHCHTWAGGGALQGGCWEGTGRGGPDPGNPPRDGEWEEWQGSQDQRAGEVHKLARLLLMKT